MTPQEDDVLLILLVQSGDTAAFEKLLRRLYAPMRKYVRNLAGESNADDILQDVSWQIFRQIRHLREPKVFRAWTFRIATRIAFHYLKRQKRWQNLENNPELIRSIPVHTLLRPDELDRRFFKPDRTCFTVKPGRLATALPATSLARRDRRDSRYPVWNREIPALLWCCHRTKVLKREGRI